MCPAIHNPTSHKIHTVIRSFHAKSMSAAEISHELCAAYSQNAMGEGTVRQWCRMFKDGLTNVHNKKRSGQPLAVSDQLVRC
jgi:transposase